MSKTLLSISEVSKSFKLKDRNMQVLQQVDFDINEGEIFSLLGHSGCGKTTLLRMICGLNLDYDGEILLEGKRITAPSKDVIMLFQTFNQLLPWKTVLGNVMHPILATGITKKRSEAREMAMQRLKDVGLVDFYDSYPSQLSGGMKQRVALVRALALSPKILVMDEPFASLDYSTKKKLQKITIDECKKNNTTVILVTHDVEEAITMSDRICVLKPNPGRVMEIIDNKYVKCNLEQDKINLMTHVLGLLSQE